MLRKLIPSIYLLCLMFPAYALSQGKITLPVWGMPGIYFLSIAIPAIGLFLCWLFHNSREFNLLLILGLCCVFFHDYYWSSVLDVSQRLFLLDLVSVLLPLNFLINIFISERGIWNRHGVKRLTFVLIQIIAVTLLIRFDPFDLSNVLKLQIISAELFQKTVINQMALVIFCLALATMYIRWLYFPHLLRGALALALFSISIALHYINNLPISTLYFMLSELIIVSAVVINAYHLAYMDELTRLPSRRSLKQHLMTLGKSYAIAMVDVDHFKKLNDTHGHDVGDDVLKLLATHLESVEGGGKAFRYGGEEFTIVYDGKTAKEAAVYLEILRIRIEISPFIIRHKKRPRKKPENTNPHTGTKQLNITVSIGVADIQESHESPQDVIKSADDALYKAKKKGRNQVVTA